MYDFVIHMLMMPPQDTCYGVWSHLRQYYHFSVGVRVRVRVFKFYQGPMNHKVIVQGLAFRQDIKFIRSRFQCDRPHVTAHFYRYPSAYDFCPSFGSTVYVFTACSISSVRIDVRWYHRRIRPPRASLRLPDIFSNVSISCTSSNEIEKVPPEAEASCCRRSLPSTSPPNLMVCMTSRCLWRSGVGWGTWWRKSFFPLMHI